MPISEVILTAMLLLSIAMLAAGLLRRASIPYTVLLVLIGLALSELAEIVPLLQNLHHFTLTPELVFFLFLPALIFESGLSLNARQLLKDLAPILTLAVPALLISTTLIGYGVWWLLDIDLAIALLFGALISATDPVAVVALFKELGAPLRLNVLVEGESLFNDATAIVVFSILLGMALEDSRLGWLESSAAMFEFVRVFAGGALLGLGIGLLISEFLYRLQSPVSAVLVMSVVAAYLSFILGEHLLHVSGVMATLGAAVAINSYGLTRISLEVKPILLETWEFIGLIANSLLFLLVGLSIDSLALLNKIDTILLVVLIVLLARAATVYPLVPLTTRLFGLPAISWAERHIMWWGGLKGGLAIAIVLSIPHQLPGRDLLVNLTLGVVLFTLMVNAWSIRPLMRRLKLDQLDEDETEQWHLAIQQAVRNSHAILQRYHEQELLNATQFIQLRQEISQQLLKDEHFQARPASSRNLSLAALQKQQEALEQLYQTGMVAQYSYLDLSQQLQLERDTVCRPASMAPGTLERSTKPLFERLESAVLRALREKNWATGWLERYQQWRLRQQLERLIASIVLTRAALKFLHQDQVPQQQRHGELLDHYHKRLLHLQQSLSDLRRDFADYVERSEHQMFLRGALMRSALNLKQQQHHGELGIKAYQRAQQQLDRVLERSGRKPFSAEPQPLIANLRQIALFNNLSDAALEQLMPFLRNVQFLAGDTIIGEGEKGDALYMISHGEAEASRANNGSQERLGILKAGDVFGEMALLGDHIRSASVTACSAVTVWRLARSDYLYLAAQHREIGERLEQVRLQRE